MINHIVGSKYNVHCIQVQGIGSFGAMIVTDPCVLWSTVFSITTIQREELIEISILARDRQSCWIKHANGIQTLPIIDN